ncbi:hypothetical protein [Halobacteriovorax sp. HLS]|uniref:hypothetical protein n=1 Tax=Halobacteriovorax sp. HLS TaxID=2234000 RepID=UPI000FD6EB86|nr:hypothetical protein [Halobacteriovorax sp. HLS]
MKFLNLLKLVFNYKQLKNDEEVRFRLINGLKIASIPFFTLFILMVFLWVFLYMDLVFFKANGYANFDQFSEVFFDYIFSNVFEYAVILIGFFSFILIFGIYLSELLLRPFKVIGDYCESWTEGKKSTYDPDFFSDLKLLTRFSEWFFNTVEISKQNGTLGPIEVPEKFTRIHQPVFEKGFFLQFSSLILISSICTAILFYEVIGGVHQQVVQMAYEILPGKKEIQYFLLNQSSILNGILLGVIITHVIAYIIMAMSMYNKVATPAFGIFATMRSFIKGRYDSRVHLIGFYYLRPQCRKLNKYLSEVQKTLVNADKN